MDIYNYSLLKSYLIRDAAHRVLHLSHVIYRLVIVALLQQLSESGALDSLKALILALSNELITYNYVC